MATKQSTSERRERIKQSLLKIVEEAEVIQAEMQKANRVSHGYKHQSLAPPKGKDFIMSNGQGSVSGEYTAPNGQRYEIRISKYQK